MKVILAQALGMCFGVRDALARIESIEDPHSVTIYGDLVHNESVLRHLRQRGFHSTGEVGRSVPETARVLITAHGLSNRERETLRRSGKDLIDTTCPLVRRAHQAALELAAEGRHVVVIGRPGHVEVRGLTGDLMSHTVIERKEDVRPLGHRRIGVVCQTTTREETARPILARLAKLNPDADLRYVNTICRPTRRRQRAVAILLRAVQALVVVGGKHSNNTRALVERAKRSGVRVRHVQSPSDLHPDWFCGIETVGLTAGTSTLPTTVVEVHRALKAIAQRSVTHVSGGS